MSTSTPTPTTSSPLPSSTPTPSSTLPDLPQYHYLAMPVSVEVDSVPVTKHITICSLDKLNKAQTLVPIRSLMRLFHSHHLPTSTVHATLHSKPSEGFVNLPRTVVQVDLPPTLAHVCPMVFNTLAINRTGVHDTYRPHITFESIQEAEAFIKKHPTVPLSKASLFNAKTKEEVFSIPFTEPPATPTWSPAYFEYLNKLNDWLF